jgi:hypothetical protein
MSTRTHQQSNIHDDTDEQHPHKKLKFNHQQNHHTNINTIQCKQCQQYILNTSFDLHMLHHERMNKKKKNHTKHTNHEHTINNNHQNQSETIPCEICHEQIIVTNYEKHIQIHQNQHLNTNTNVEIKSQICEQMEREPTYVTGKEKISSNKILQK